MAICGYNDKIGDGLRILVEGMIEALEKKAESASANEVLDRELIELEAMISTMKRARGDTLPEMFVGLNMLAKALFERVQNNLRQTNGEDIARECKSVGKAFIHLLSETEKRNEFQKLAMAKNMPVDKLATALAEWVLSQSASEAPAVA